VIVQELHTAWRGLLARPAFALLVIAVLATGLGCVLFVAGMINGLIVRPLPFDQPQHLFDAGLIDNDDAPDSESFDSLNADELLGWRDALGAQAEVAAYGQRTVNLSDGERPERHAGAAVSANLFATLGVAPMLGRDFSVADEQPGAPLVVLLSSELWRTRFGADRQIVGREVRVNTQPARIVGVMPDGVSFPFSEDVWIPATLARGDLGQQYAVVLRGREGVGQAALRAQLDGWLAGAMQRDPDRMRNRASAIGLQPLEYRFVDRANRSLFWAMAVAVILVLLIACANVTNLLLTQTANRQQELWVRSALGAGRRRLAVHLLAQTGLLAFLSVAVALPAAALMLDATVAVFSASQQDGPPRWMRFELDAGIVALAVIAAAATALLTAAIPAVRVGAGSDRGAGTRVHSGRGFARMSRTLVVAEVALSCALLIGASVLVQAILKLDRFDLGLRTDNVLSGRIALFQSRYPDDAAVRAYTDRLLRTLREDPLVADVSISSSLPGLMGENVDVLERGAAVPANGIANIGTSAVDAGFGRVMGATVVAGRFFDAADGDSGERRIVVDETFVRQFVPDGQAVGRRFVLDPASADSRREATVIGVIRAVQMDDIDDQREASVIELFDHSPKRYFSVLLRARGSSLDLSDHLMRVAAQIDADTPVYWIRGYEQVLNEATFGVRILSRIFAGFGLIALLMAAAGLYGVVAFAVAQRTREIGLRRALGAPDARVLASVAGRNLIQVGVGLALGLVLGLPFARWLSSPIAHLASVEPSAWLTVLATLALTSLFAVWIPARRALRVDPMVALRHD
jgi:putative ABC transport system permease protein